jgi:signal transduction histidine kinase
MAQRVRVLLVEDSEPDAELCLLELRRFGFEVDCRRVETAASLRDALTEPWDVVVSDYMLPGFDARAALAIVRETGLDLPFIICSGAIGEETAVEALKAGAHDFLVKGRLARLGPAIEREMREAAGRHERRAAELAAETAKREKLSAEAASEAKSRFLANMSHELRTPLTAIIGFSELLTIGMGGTLSERQKVYARTIHESGQHLLALINEILDLAKVEAGRVTLNREWVVFSQIANSVCEGIAPLAAKKDIRVDVSIADGFPKLLVDPTRLRQILYNLLSNAVKFTPRSGEIALDARVDGDRAIIRVRDSGVGISQEDLPRLFREFEQLGTDNVAMRQGTGLGLALTKRLVELHGGTITAESELGRGTIFQIRLPVSHDATSAGEPPAAAPEPSSSTTGRASLASVLLVDDDPPSLELMRAILEHAGHNVVSATTLAEAVGILQVQAIDLVATDVALPDGGGEQILQEVRSHPDSPSTPVVAMTGQALVGDRERFLALGFDAYLSKPITLHQLVATVDAALRVRPAPTGHRRSDR